MERYSELVALHLSEETRLQELLKEQGQVILALDGLQPDVGHEVRMACCVTVSVGRFCSHGRC